jgi:Sulfotransferase family
MTLPNFLIVGAMKAGTSAVRDILAEHPEVYVAPGEVGFFAGPRFPLGIEWYASHFDGARGARAVGEICPTYSFAPGVAQRIADALPDARIVFLFRDPVARAYSNYWHRVARGEERRSFSRAVDLELAGTQTSIWAMYLKRSYYVEQVERFKTHYPLERMYYALYENFCRSPATMLAGLCRFLGVSDNVELKVNHRANVTRIPRSRHAAWLAHRLLKPPLAEAVIRKLRRNPAGYPAMHPELRDRLAAHFEPFNERLSESTGMDVSVWRR